MRGKRHSERGLTLVELIVVLAIIALLSAIAVPGLARLGAFSDDSLPRASREVYQLLTAARIYATTWNVRTAVVYNLDNYQTPQQNPANTPLFPEAFVKDSITGGPVRYITAASLMYALPGSEQRFGAAIGQIMLSGPQAAFVPVLGNEGQWKQFVDNVAVLLMDPRRVEDPSYSGDRNVYFSDAPRFDVGADNAFNGVSALGMSRGIPVILDYDALVDAQRAGAPPAEQSLHLARFVAHVFSPDGRLDTFNTRKERFRFYVGYRPDDLLERRLNNADYTSFTLPETDAEGKPVLNLRAAPIEIYRSTGRVKIAS